jgi:hypothetical protein
MNIKEVLFANPFLIEKTPDVTEVAEFFLPYSTGFEIECSKADSFDESAFNSVPYLMETSFSSSEQRFRIPAGFEGFRCLHKLSDVIKDQLLLNEGSGIHYHVDFTDCFDKVSNESIERTKEYILKELDTWEYKGTYNQRDVRRNRCWVRVHERCKTFEFRIGEMTFNYDLLLKRITHVNEISKVVKEDVLLYSSVDDILKEQIKKEKILSRYTDNIQGVIMNRKIKIGGN